MRVQVLMRLFLNPSNRAYLREMATEFGASPGQLRDELNHLSEAGLVESERVGRQVYYRANDEHSLYPELNSMVRKATGMDRILDSILRRLGNLKEAHVIDDCALGRDTGLVDLVLLGDIDYKNLHDLVEKTERYLQRKIRVLVFGTDETKEHKNLLKQRSSLRLW